MKYFVFLILACLMGGVYGCASTIDALSNNTSGDMVRGVKLQAGIDASSGSPVPTVNFTMGSLARKGKDDRTVMVIDNNTTNIVSESYDLEANYASVGTDPGKVRQILIKEERTSSENQLDEGIVVSQDSNFSIGITSGNPFNFGGKTYISIGKVGSNTPVVIEKANIEKSK